MFTTKEITHIFLVGIILVFVVAFKETISSGIDILFVGTMFAFILLTILLNVIAKKSMAQKYESTLETSIWNWERFGFKRERRLNKPIPAGIIFPFLLTILSYGNFFLFTVLESNITGTSARGAKSHGRFRFTEMTDTTMSFIIGAGVLANLALAIIAYLVDLSVLARFSIYYASWSLIPFGNLDGTKIFFGNRNYWFLLVVITGIFLLYALAIPS